MSNPPPPIVPNFQPGVGRLATDRYDFEAHILGNNFRHQANQTDLFPTLIIGENTYANVQSALAALAAIINPSVPNKATIGTSVTNLGIVTLGGDFSGVGSTALIPRVGAIQGRPVQNITPSTGQVLTWNSGGYWYPTNSSSNFIAANDLAGLSTSQTVIGIQNNSVPVPTGSGTVLTWSGSSFSWASVSSFTAGGDISGNNTSQQVNAFTGNGAHPNKKVFAHNDYITFDAISTPYITQTYVPGSGSTVANNMTIKAQGVSVGIGGSPSQLGGTLVLAGGAIPISGGTLGGVSLSIGGDPFTSEGAVVFQIAEVFQNNATEPTVAAFFPVTSITGVTQVDIPHSIGGNNFIYIGDTATPPTGPSTTGTLLWSQGGKLRIMQENGITFAVSPNNEAWSNIANGIACNAGVDTIIATATITPSSTGHLVAEAFTGLVNLGGGVSSYGLLLWYNNHGAGLSGAKQMGVSLPYNGTYAQLTGNASGLTVGTSYDVYFTLLATGGTVTTNNTTIGSLYVREANV